MIIYPPVVTGRIKPLSKKKYILSVGRFFGFKKPKKHEVMIKTFKSLYLAGNVDNWSLHLAGAASTGDQKYLENLKKSAIGVPIFFYPNVSFEDLVKLYGISSIYWHATGFGESDPEKMEHFGITTVEAMAGGCVPVVINLGGQKEIVKDKVSGLLWDDLAQLEEETISLVKNQSKLQKLSKNAVKASKQFSRENFSRKIKGLIYV
jgi:glycosyltransferase involved in cell wall biosynthesis